MNKPKVSSETNFVIIAFFVMIIVLAILYLTNQKEAFAYALGTFLLLGCLFGFRIFGN